MKFDDIASYVLYLERKVNSLETIIEELRGTIEQQRTESGVRYRDAFFPMDHIKDTNN